MDAFEHVVAEIFWSLGYWVRTSVKVDLSKAEKVEIGLPSMPRPEIDLVAYHGGSNRLLALECKSYLDSRGVTYVEICGDADSKTYKLFRRQKMREVVLRRLGDQMVEQEMCRPDVKVQLGLVAGKVYGRDESKLLELFGQRDWFFRGPAWLKAELTKLAGTSYENQVSAVVTKLLLR
ncbi:MAG: hypothetical protein KF780_02390 [Sphingomonas sp.]|nr:hypothetical protein [Sphingomonas sp.]